MCNPSSLHKAIIKLVSALLFTPQNTGLCVIWSLRHLPTAGLTFYFFQAREWGRIRINLTSIHSCNSGGKEHRLVTELLAELRLHPMTNQQGSKPNLPYIALHQIQPACHNPWQHHNRLSWINHVLAGPLQNLSSLKEAPESSERGMRGWERPGTRQQEGKSVIPASGLE